MPTSPVSGDRVGWDRPHTHPDADRVHRNTACLPLTLATDMRSRTLVVLTPYAVLPPRHGPQVRVAGVLSHLGEHWQVEHFAQAIQRTDLPLPARSVRGGPRWVEHRICDPVSWAWLIGLTKLGGYPAAFADRLLAWLPRRTIREALRRADCVLVSPHYQHRWVERHTPPDTGIVVEVHSIERDLWKARRRAWTKRIVREIHEGEARACASADACFATCDEDAEVVRAYGCAQVAVIPNGVDLERFRPVSDAAGRQATRRRLGLPEDGALAVFVGAAGFANRNAMQPLEQQAEMYARSGITVVVVGRVGQGRRPVPNIRWVGEVDDPAEWLRAADVALCPLLDGSGTSIKSVEYLAAGLPIVSTHVGMRGLGVRDGVEAVICPVEMMPARAAEVLARPDRGASLGEAARRLAERRYSWAAAGDAATAVFDALAARRDRARTRGALGRARE